MSWFFLILISVFIVSFANILQRSLLKEDASDPIAYSMVFVFLIGFISLVVSLFTGLTLPPINVNLVFFFIAAFLWGMGNIFYFKALKLLESSEVVILASSRSLITIAASVFFLGAIFNIQMLFGTIVILSSIFLVTNLKEGLRFNRGVLYTFAMAAFCGLAVIFDVVNLRSTDPISYLATINIVIGIILMVLFPRKVTKIKGMVTKKFLQKMLPIGILSTSQAVAYYLALSKGPAAQIAPIGQSQIILTIILAAILLKEKDHLVRKIIAGILVMIGVLLLK